MRFIPESLLKSGVPLPNPRVKIWAARPLCLPIFQPFMPSLFFSIQPHNHTQAMFQHSPSIRLQNHPVTTQV